MLDDKMIYRLRRFLQHGRIGIGLISLALPGLILSALGVKRTGGTRMLVRLFGSREIAMGAGTLLAEKSGNEAVWFKLGTAVDLCDAVVFKIGFLTGKLRRPRALVFALLATGAAACGAVVSLKVGEVEQVPGE